MAERITQEDIIPNIIINLYFIPYQVSSLLFNVDMRILIDKALTHFYMLYEMLMLCKHGNILFSTLKENTILNIFLLYTYCRNTYLKGERS